MSRNLRNLLIGGGLGLVLATGVMAALLLLNPGEPAGSSSSSRQQRSQPKDVKAEVEQAYLDFWEVWTEANLRLNHASMSKVTNGPALDALTDQIQEQRAKNQPVRIKVDHNYEIFMRDPDTASVEDKYINHSVRIDPETQEPIEQDPNMSVRKSHTLKRTEGTWLVVEIIEYR